MGWTIWGSNPGRGKRFFLSPKHPNWPWGSPILFIEYQGSCSEIRLLGHEVDHSPPSSAEV